MIATRYSLERFGLILAFCGACAVPAAAQSVVTYHADFARSGHYVEPSLSWSAASGVHMDTGFSASISGQVYAQPLYWQPSNSQPGEIIVATESNNVYALDANTGAQVWVLNLGAPTPKSLLGCGNIDPVGVTGTPVIDAATGTLYLDALIKTDSGPRHQIFGITLATHRIAAGWPIDVADALSTLGQSFDSTIQGQRSALTIVNGELYVTYAGNWGDCGDYHGWAIGFDLTSPALAGAWATRAQGGGSWGQSGIAYDGSSMFLATGNTFNAKSWGDGEAVIRLAANLAHSGNKKNYFAPADWRQLDSSDLDLGGTAPLPLDIPIASGTAHRILALGKDGNAYLLDRDNLGGIGGQLATMAVSNAEIITGPATYVAGGSAMVAFSTWAGSSGTQCPGSESGNLVMLKIGSGANGPVSTAWCKVLNGYGSPIITTTNGTADPIVWVVGAEGDNGLHGFRGTNGAAVFSGGAMNGLHHFQTILAANNHFYVAADDTVYAFAY